MIKNISKLVRYDLKRVIEKKNIIIFLILIATYFIIKSPYKYIGDINMFDIVCLIQMEDMLPVLIISILSVYLSSVVFIDRDLDQFVKIRIGNKRKWFTSKILSIILINILLFLSISLISLILGIVVGNFKFGWGDGILSRVHAYPYAGFYSHFKLIIINMITFVLFMSSICILIGIICVKTNKSVIGMGCGFFYMVASPALSFMASTKLINSFIFTNYIVFNRRNFMNTEAEMIFLTTRESVIYPLILLTLVLIVSIYVIKFVDFKGGDKKYE